MHPTAVLLSALAVAIHSGLVAGDVLAILRESTGDVSTSLWHTDCGTFPVDASNECRDPSVLNVYEFCMHWLKKRAHFCANGQPVRCLRESFARDFPNGCYQGNSACWAIRFEGTPCTWIS
jgi:hypothetical protein